STPPPERMSCPKPTSCARVPFVLEPCRHPNARRRSRISGKAFRGADLPRKFEGSAPTSAPARVGENSLLSLSTKPPFHGDNIHEPSSPAPREALPRGARRLF